MTGRADRHRSALATIRLLGAGAVAAAVLAATDPALPAPPLHDPGAVAGWADHHGAATAGIALLHHLAVAATALVVALGTLHLLAAVTPGRPGAVIAVAARRFTPAAVRIALGLAVTGAATAGPARADTTTPTTVAAPDATDAPDTVTMTHLGGERIPVHAPPPAPVPQPDRADVWLVEAGDHLWRIAEETLAEHLGRAPTDAEIDPYWRRVVAANRDRLVHPDDPDVILPGQELVVPPVAPAIGLSSGTPAGS